MPREIGTTGTGMTERTIVAFGDDDPRDVQMQINAAIFAFDLTSFQRLSERIGEMATSILENAGLPRSAEGRYLIQGVDPDSPEGYAARALMQLGEIGKALKGAQFDAAIDQAMAMAFALGGLVTEAGIKEVWEADAMHNFKRRKSVSEAARERWKRHGWGPRANELQAMIDQKHREKPDLSYTHLCRIVARAFDCSPSSVYRHTQDPTENSDQ